jgi:hypothetical protein
LLTIGAPVRGYDPGIERVGLAQIIAGKPEDEIPLRLIDVLYARLRVDGIGPRVI